MKRQVLIFTALAGITGCGGSGSGIPGGADQDKVAVIRGWADTLRHGDVKGAAAYFALPSAFSNGGTTLKITTAAEAVAINETLPCGATLISATPHAHYVEAKFRLGGRSGPGGSSCSGSRGATARTDFVIAGGKIKAWLRAPDVSGDNSGQSSPGLGTTGPVI